MITELPTTMRTSIIVAALAVCALQQSTWTFVATPTVSIGTEDGPEPTQLSRVFGATRLPDGTIVVGNTGSSQMRFFDAKGAYRKSAGTRGAGPGEFAEYTSVNPKLVGRNQIYIDDSGNKRINVYDLSGTYVRTFRFDAIPERGWTVIAAVAGNSLVGMSTHNSSLQGPPGSIIESQFEFALFDTTGRRIRKLFDAAGQPRYVNAFRGVTHYPFLPLTASAHVVATSDRVFLLRNDSPTIEVWSFDGQRAGTLTLPTRQTETREIWPNLKASLLASIARAKTESPNDRSWLYEHFYQADLPLRKFAPVAHAMLLSDDGNLWVERFHFPDEKQRVWDVLSTTGRLLGSVTTPLGLEVFQIGTDFMLAKGRDSLDVEQVRVYRVQKNAPGR